METTILGLYKDNGTYYNQCGHIRIVEKNMETTIMIPEATVPASSWYTIVPQVPEHKLFAVMQDFSAP